MLKDFITVMYKQIRLLLHKCTKVERIIISFMSEIIDCGESEKMKISGKLDKSDPFKGFSSCDISFFIQRISSDKTFFWVY